MEKDRSVHQRKTPLGYAVWLFPLLTLLAILFTYIINRNLHENALISESLHSAVESLGFLAALFLAVHLVTEYRDDTEAVFCVWVTTGLLSMSILGVLHSFVLFGNTFVWLHSIALLFGGLFFAISPLPYSRRRNVRDMHVVFFALAVILVGVISTSKPDILPQMLSEGIYTNTTIAVTMTAGVLFSFAAIFFFSRYLSTKQPRDMLFSCFTGFHAVAGFLFTYQLPWQDDWWFLHALSYVILLVYTLVIYRRSDARIRTAEESFRHIMRTSIDGFFIADTNARIVEANEAYCRLTGYKRSELLNMSIPDIEAVEKREEVAGHVRKILAEGKDRFETRHRCKDGKMVDIEASVHYLPGGKFFAFVHDISERKKAQQQLIANDRLASLGLLASGIAHEVGNPLTIITGYADNLLTEHLPDHVKEDLITIDEQSRRASSILRNLLTFSRAESEKKQLLNVNESIARVLGLRVYYQKLNKIETNLNLAPDLPKIMGNRSRLEQVFFNIIVNAEFSMSQGHQRGNLTITTERNAGFIRVVIADDGSGITRENLSRLFTPFFTTKRLGEGTGLGLSICQGIVSEHGGRIHAESEPEKGAAFTIKLPLPSGSSG